MKNIMEGMNNRLLEVQEIINEMDIREGENNEAEDQREENNL